METLSDLQMMKIFLITLVETISLPGSHWSLLEPFLLSSSGYVRMFLVYNNRYTLGQCTHTHKGSVRLDLNGRSWNVVIVVEV